MWPGFRVSGRVPASESGPLRCVWARLGHVGFVFLGAKDSFLGGFGEDMGNHIVPSVVMSLSKNGTCVPCCKAARVKSASQSKGGELAHQLQEPGALRRRSSLLATFHQGVQNMCVAQVGQAAPSAWRTVHAELCFCGGHVWVMGSFELRPKAVA